MKDKIFPRKKPPVIPSIFTNEEIDRIGDFLRPGFLGGEPENPPSKREEGMTEQEK